MKQYTLFILALLAVIMMIVTPVIAGQTDNRIFFTILFEALGIGILSICGAILYSKEVETAEENEEINTALKSMSEYEQ